MWMGRCLDTNDSEEITFAVEVLDSHLRDVFSSAPNLAEIRGQMNNMVMSIPNSIHFCSFTKNPDLLSQWRGYAPDGGVAFGFSFKQIRAISLHCGLYSRPVEYNYEVQQIIIDPIAKKFVDAFSRDGEERNKRANQAFVDFLRVAPFIKHEAFAEEEEWRIVYMPHGASPLSPEHMVVGGKGRSVVKMPIQIESFQPSFLFGSIHTSPSDDPILDIERVKSILNKHNLNSHLIAGSGIPYQRRT
jgi:hypothetical protein